jgi:hypothetical protein
LNDRLLNLGFTERLIQKAACYDGLSMSLPTGVSLMTAGMIMNQAVLSEKLSWMDLFQKSALIVIKS